MIILSAGGENDESPWSPIEMWMSNSYTAHGGGDKF